MCEEEIWEIISADDAQEERQDEGEVFCTFIPQIKALSLAANVSRDSRIRFKTLKQQQQLQGLQYLWFTLFESLKIVMKD